MRLAMNGRIGRRCAAGCSVLLVCLAAVPGVALAQKDGSVLITPSSRASEDRPDRVLVLPFAPVGPTESWRGRSVQQSLVADLTAAAPARVGAADTSASDAAAAVAVAKQAGARYVVFGAVTSAGSELRYTGQVVDATSGQPVAGLKATGPATDAFRLEDALAAQLKRQLSLGKADGPARPAPDSADAAPADQPRASALPVIDNADPRPADAPARGQIVIVPGHPRSATQPASDPSDDPRNDVNGQPVPPLVQLRSLDAADVYGGPIVYYPPCDTSYYSYGGCYAGGIRAYGYGLGYGYGGFRSHSYGGFRSSFGGFRSSGVGSHGAVGGGHSHGHNFAARR